LGKGKRTGKRQDRKEEEEEEYEIGAAVAGRRSR
jgi:hypothetical protein